jgi:DNA polymerase III psi subunit
MQLSPSQQRILADMGIQVWALRRPEARVAENMAESTTETDVPLEQIQLDANIRMLLVMEETQLSETAQRLLNAMLKALLFDRQQVAIFSLADFRKLALHSLADRAVLLMGTAVSQQLQPQQSPMASELIEQDKTTYAVCPSLEDMLQKPAAKAAVWQTLKPLRDLLKG